ncbi:hypothetical protein F4808DRAFT_360925 [Astrocystis sublimbata]|nr:hypothetical protein F4808DRAFT_360925 [Astrocystis sublimbata]
MASSSQNLEATLGDDVIADTAERARQLLLCCQEITDEIPRKLASTQLARFNLWASNIGVFAARHASLSYRLRTALSVKTAVEGNLDILCKYLLTTLKAFPHLAEDEFNAFFDTTLSQVSIFGDNLLQKSTSHVDVRTRQLELVEARITVLHQLSLAIRRASSRNTLLTIPRLLDFDAEYTFLPGERREDGSVSKPPVAISNFRFDITADFEEFVRRALTSRWLQLRPSSEDDLDEHQKSYQQTLLERCVTTVSRRRRQLAYFRAHQNRLEQKATKGYVSLTRADTKLKQEDGIQQTGPPDMFQGLDLSVSRSAMFAHEPVDATNAETVVSEFVPSNFKMPLPSAAPSSIASTIAGRGFQDGSTFDVPPPPKLDEQEKEKECPYCYLVLPAKTFSTQKKAKRWERHLLEDLQPYVCLFVNCNMPGKTYSSFKAWQAHLDQPHYHSWHCRLHPKNVSSSTDNNGQFTFGTLLKFQSHLKIFHPNLEKLSADDSPQYEHQLAVLPQWCFVCFDTFSETAALLQHMANHFKAMSVLALPWRDDIGDEETVASDEAINEDATNSNQDIQLTDLAAINLGEETNKTMEGSAK